MSQSITDLAVDWFENVWNHRQTERIPEFIADDCCGFDATGDMIDRAEFTNRYQALLKAIPDLHITIESTVAQGDEIVVRWSASGAHQGDGLGFEATGRPVDIHGLTWLRVRDGKFVEARDCWNLGRMVESLRAGCPA